MSTPVTITPQQGIVNPGAKLNQPLGSFRSMLNCRLVRGGGAVEQTPPFIALTGASHTQGAYYDAGSQTEPTTSRPSLLIGITSSGLGPLSASNTGSFWAGKYGTWVSSSQVQVIKQTTVPVGVTLFTGCLLVVNDYAALGMNLGGTLVVTMTAPAVFQYVLNGGAPVAGLVPSTSGVSIEAGDATLYFQANTGFVGTESWTWTRSDWFFEAAGTEVFYDWSYTTYNRNIYFCDGFNRLMVYENGGVRSIGYRPVYGSHVVMFENHLVVGNYSLTTFTAFTGDSNVVGSSDLNNFDYFFPTDTNEADTYPLPGSVLDGDWFPSASICGLWVYQDFVYIFTTLAVYRTPYFGLPTPFSIKKVANIGTLRGFAQPVTTSAGVYLVTTSGIVYYQGGIDGVRVSNQLDGIGEYYTATNRNAYTFYNSLYWGGYDSYRREVYFSIGIITTQTTPYGTLGFWVYQEETRTWYFRAASILGGSPQCMCSTSGVVRIGSRLGALHEDTNYSQSLTIAADFNAAASIALPTFETQDLTFDDVQTIHEINELFLETGYDAATSLYDPTGVLVEVSTRETAKSAVTYTTVGTWTTAATSGELSYNGSGRIFRFRISVTTSGATKASRGFVFNALILGVHNLKKNDVRR